MYKNRNFNGRRRCAGFKCGYSARSVAVTAVGEFGMKCIGIEDSFEGILGETKTTKLTTKASAEFCRAAERFSARATAEVSAKWWTARLIFPENADRRSA
jgi:hypothetical protein